MKLVLIMFSALMLAFSSCGKVPLPAEKAAETAPPAAESPEVGITPSYFLTIPFYETYESEKDGLKVQVKYFNNYLGTVVTNNGSKAKTIGGDYRIQRKTDGAYRDVSHGTVNLVVGGVHVNDMPRVIVRDYPDGNETKPAENDSITLDLGESKFAELLIADHEIFNMPEYAGEYRLIYGGVTVDFTIICDEAV